MKTIPEIIDMAEQYAEQRLQGVDAHGILADIERAIREREQATATFDVAWSGLDQDSQAEISRHYGVKVTRKEPQ